MYYGIPFLSLVESKKKKKKTDQKETQNTVKFNASWLLNFMVRNLLRIQDSRTVEPGTNEVPRD